MALDEKDTKQALLHKDAFGVLCNISVVEMREGYAKMQMPLDDLYKNAAEVMHGGALYTLADIAFGMACNVDQTHVMLNINASINYMKMGKIGPFTAEATKLSGTKKVETYQVHVFDGNEERIAVAQFTGYRTQIPHSA